MDKAQELTNLLMETGQAHHEAFIETDGDDPEWPLWYANYLQKPLSDFFDHTFTQSKIVFEFMRMAETLDTEGKKWPEVYAQDLVEKYG